MSYLDFLNKYLTGRSAVWLARLPWEQEVGGSNPLAPTIIHHPLIYPPFETIVQ